MNKQKNQWQRKNQKPCTLKRKGRATNLANSEKFWTF